MDNKLNTNKVLFNKLNDYFKENFRISLINGGILFIVTKEDMCLMKPDKRIVHSIALSNTRSKLKRSISLIKNNN
jgi:hypothetical protein